MDEYLIFRDDKNPGVMIHHDADNIDRIIIRMIYAMSRKKYSYSVQKSRARTMFIAEKLALLNVERPK